MLRLGGHAVVIGGSIAGLMTARVLSDFFAQVTVIERDDIEERPIIHKSIPQGNHFHGLLQGGHQILCSFFPGFAEDLRSHGAVRLRMDGDVAWYLPDGKALPVRCVSRTLWASKLTVRVAVFLNFLFDEGHWLCQM